MWLDCLTDRPYETREDLAQDVVRVLREELHYLLAAGTPLVQLDEPVLTEVVFGAPTQSRSFMCGALSEKLEPEAELDFAVSLLNEVTRGLPEERLGLHVCRGNWTRDESAALSGDYRPLMGVLKEARVGVLFLELCTERAGEVEVLGEIPDDKRIGVGVVNQKAGCCGESGGHRAPNRPSRGHLWQGPDTADSRLWIRHLRRQPGGFGQHCGGQAEGNRGGARLVCGGLETVRGGIGLGVKWVPWVVGLKGARSFRCRVVCLR